MSHKKVAVIGNTGAGVICAQALLNQIVHERENPPLLIVPNLETWMLKQYQPGLKK